MRKFLFLLLSAVMFSYAAAPCIADTVHGVIAEERIINLPNDQAKWYVSVVGDANDARYREILGWFKTNERLKNLKRQVHFCPVTTDTTIYAKRYAPNIKGLPTIRLQRANGVVVYEVSGKDVPMSPEGLNGAMASSVDRRLLLPWRRNHVHPQPAPSPDPLPPVDPEPAPLDDGAAPDFGDQAKVVAGGVIALLIVICAAVGAITGMVVQWQKTYPE